MQCGIFNAISKKHFRYSRFVKRIIAIEALLYFLGLVGPYEPGLNSPEGVEKISYSNVIDVKRIKHNSV